MIGILTGIASHGVGVHGDDRESRRLPVDQQGVSHQQQHLVEREALDAVVDDSVLGEGPLQMPRVGLIVVESEAEGHGRPIDREAWP